MYLYFLFSFYLVVHENVQVSRLDASSSDTSDACGFHDSRTSQREDASDDRAHSESASLSLQ